MIYSCLIPPRVREFESRTGQILNSVTNGSPPLQHLRK